VKKASFHRRRKRREEEEGRTLEVIVERILPGGAGLAHAEGRTVLVGLAAPGDHLVVEIERTQGRVSFARIKEITKPSPLRIEPPCPYFGRCGGCDFQQLNYQSQLEAKVEMIRDCLRRIARAEPPGEIPITPSPLEWRYRARAQWQYDARRKLLGYYERGTREVCDIAECPVLVPEVQEVLTILRERVKGNSMPQGMSDFQAVAGDEGTSVAPPLEEDSTSEVSREIGGHRYRFSAEGFFQINQSLLPELVRFAVDGATGENALDLYCGVGLFTLPLAERFRRVTAIEGVASAVEYARRNLADARLTNATVECASVGEWLRANADGLAPVDLVLLDPPRTGLEEGAAAALLALRPRRITYVSCDPATLARDLREMFDAGYTLHHLRAFDMFPQTHHVETVAFLQAS
jgi:23S rRNA (uracil1939-C5)-methyltransferase